MITEGALLLDVREDDEWAAGHAPGATSAPLSRLATMVQTIPANRLLVCVCHVGARSAQAARALNEAGWSAVNVGGGMAAWAAVGLPVVDDAGRPGQVI